jgi:hypothetical protein
MLQLERANIEEERQRLTVWGSLLKKQTTSKKQPVATKQELLSKIEATLKQEEVTISLLDAQA